MEILKLEPVTKNTILCDISVLKKAVNFYIEHNFAEFDNIFCHNVQEELVENLNLSINQIADIYPYLKEELDNMYSMYISINELLNENETDLIDGESNPERYEYLVDEVPIVDSIKLRKYLSDFLSDNYNKNYTELITTNTVENIILKLNEKEIEIEEIYGGAYHNEPLFSITSLHDPEVEVQVEVSQLSQDIDNFNIDYLEPILDQLSRDYCLKDYKNIKVKKYPCFYQYIYTDTYIYCGYSFKILDEIIAKIADNYKFKKIDLLKLNPLLSLTEYEAMQNTDEGFCVHCLDFTRSMVEPDAQNYECPCCEKHEVYGLDTLLIYGLVSD